MNSAPPLRHIHILGGGVGAITAAFHLSAAGWRHRFSGITVHQMGWRLGGKGSSGRNMAKSARIEEHGLHIWFGFYENAFRMLNEPAMPSSMPSTQQSASEPKHGQVGDPFRSGGTLVPPDRSGRV